MPGARAQQRSGGLTSTHIWLIVFVALWLGVTVAFVVLLTNQEALSTQSQELQAENALLIKPNERNELAHYRDRAGGAMSMMGVVEKERQDTVALITGSGLDNLETARTKRAGLIDRIQSEGIVQGVDSDDALLTILSTVYDRLSNLNTEFNELSATNRDMARQNQDLTRRLAEKDQMFTAATSDLTSQAESNAADLARERQAMQGEVAALNTTINQMNDDQIRQLRERTNEIGELQRQIVRLEDINSAQQARLAENRPPIDPSRVAWQPDGRIVTALPGDPLVYIDIGRRDNLILGMQFQVYSPNREPNPDGSGKATIKVVRLEPDAAECLVRTTSPGDPIVEGDLVANAIFDRNRKYSFVISGRFDLDYDGNFDLDGSDRVAALIEQWGGRVVDELTETTDFVVLGERPGASIVDPNTTDPVALQRAEMARREIAQFNELKQDARVLSIPILTQAQFLAFIGYSTSESLPVRF